MRRDVFQAIADPTRRDILNMIAYHPLNVNSVSDKFDVSRAAVYKHLKILTECGLVTIKQQGRERFCEAKLEKLNEVSDWVNQYKKFWTEKLDSLENYLEGLHKSRKEDKMQEAGDGKQDARGKKQETRSKKRETRSKKRETGSKSITFVSGKEKIFKSKKNDNKKSNKHR